MPPIRCRRLVLPAATALDAWDLASCDTRFVRRDPAGPGSRGGNWRPDTVEDVRDYVAGFPEVFGGIRVDGEVVVVALTSDLEEHLRGLQASVEHPELVRVERATYPLAKLEAALRAIRHRLDGDPRHPERGGGPGMIRLKAPFAALAAELHAEYGDALKITVGHKPFPPDKIGYRQPAPVPSPTVMIPGLELTVTVDAATVLAGGELRGWVVFANRGSQRVQGTTGIITGGVRRADDAFLAGTYAGSVAFIAQTVSLEPGESEELRLIVGTDSCLPDTSYVVPSGRYEVIAAVPFSQIDTASRALPYVVARGTWITVRPS